MSMFPEAEKILNSIEDEIDLIPPHLAEWWLNYLKSHKQHYLNLLSFLGKDREIKILEVGSVPGHFTILLKNLGYNIHGLDIDPSRITKLIEKHNIQITKTDIEVEKLPFSTESFDLILFTEILEHLRINPLDALSEVTRVLKKNGRLVISTPNISPQMRLACLVLDYDYMGDPVKEFSKLKKLGHMGHIRLYSVKELQKLLDYAKLRLISIDYKGSISIPNWKVLPIQILFLFIGKHHSKNKFRDLVYVVAKRKL